LVYIYGQIFSQIIIISSKLKRGLDIITNYLSNECLYLETDEALMKGCVHMIFFTFKVNAKDVNDYLILK